MECSHRCGSTHQGETKTRIVRESDRNESFDTRLKASKKMAEMVHVGRPGKQVQERASKADLIVGCMVGLSDRGCLATMRLDRG